MKALRNRGSLFWPQMRYRLNSLKGVAWGYYTGFRVQGLPKLLQGGLCNIIQGSIMGSVKGDTTGLDYS